MGSTSRCEYLVRSRWPKCEGKQDIIYRIFCLISFAQVPQSHECYLSSCVALISVSFVGVNFKLSTTGILFDGFFCSEDETLDKGCQVLQAAN